MGLCSSAQKTGPQDGSKASSSGVASTANGESAASAAGAAPGASAAASGPAKARASPRTGAIASSETPRASGTSFIQKAEDPAPDLAASGLDRAGSVVGALPDKRLAEVMGVKDKRASGSSRRLLAALDDEKVPVVLDFAGSIQGNKKDQDRFVIVQALGGNPDMFFCGVFDGHGSCGHIIAEDAAGWLAGQVADRMAATAGADEVAMETIKGTFHAFQTKQKENYDTQVLPQVMELKKQFEEETNMEMPMSLPMVGGTTATVAIINEDKLAVGWVGDSKAVLGVVEEGGSPEKLGTKLLTKDHDVGNEGEVARAKEAGGGLCGAYVSVSGAEGMLQVTRSLGDVPHHQNDVVSHDPELASEDLGGGRVAFLVLASDGLWNAIPQEEVVQRIYGELRRAAYRESPCKANAEARGNRSDDLILLDVVDQLRTDAVAANSEKKRRSDDICVVVVTLTAFWNKRR